MERDRLQALLAAGRALAFELDGDAALQRLSDSARELTHAPHATISLLDVPDIEPHPVADGDLEVPIVIHGQRAGTLCLSGKAVGGFDADDEQTALVIADWIAIAVAGGQLHSDGDERRTELERTNQALETTTDVANALNGATDVDRVLQLVASRSLVLLGARGTALGLLDRDSLDVVSTAGTGMDTFGRTGLSASEVLADPDSFARRVMHAERVLTLPLLHGGHTLGYLFVLDRQDQDLPFTTKEKRVAEALAASAAAAVGSAQTVTDNALRISIAASEAERRRWARELHDETLQELAGIRVLLAAARRSHDPARWRTAIEDTIESIGGGIQNLRSLITELRPAALDEFGVEAAIEALVSRVVRQHSLEVNLEMDVSFGRDAATGRLPEEIEATIYRFVQEALTNVVNHAQARRVLVTLTEDNGHLEVVVRDDGTGYDPATGSAGFGLLGMRERLALVHAELQIDTAVRSGTTVRACIPLPGA